MSDMTLHEFCEIWIETREDELDQLWRDMEDPDRGEIAARHRLEGSLRAYKRVLAFIEANDEGSDVEITPAVRAALRPEAGDE